MKQNQVISALLGGMALHGVYLTVFCGIEFIVVPILYVLLAIMAYRVNLFFKYVSIVILALHTLINVMVVAFVYFPPENDLSVNAPKIFVSAGDEVRFLIEIVPVITLGAACLLLLFRSSIYRSSA